MQKRADGHDTEVGFSAAWLRSMCAAAPQAGAAPAREGAGWPPAGELAPGPGAADDPLHPVAAPMSRMDRQANASRGRPVMRGFQRPITASVYSDDSRAMRLGRAHDHEGLWLR
jgi:hypothetical protein